MAKDKKALYSKIKKALANKEFYVAEDLCGEYAAEFPEDVNGWVLSILAYLKMSEPKDLEKAKVSLTSLPPYKEAMANLNEEGRKKLSDFIAKKEALRKKSGVSEKRDVTVQTLAHDINVLKEQSSRLIDEGKAKIQEDNNRFSRIKKEGVGFFGNNVFALLMCAILILLPLQLLAKFLDLTVESDVATMIPIIIAGIIIVAVAVMQIKKYNLYLKEKSANVDACETAKMEIMHLAEEMKQKTTKRKKLLKEYKTLKKKSAHNK